jgi:hypothetical protein
LVLSLVYGFKDTAEYGSRPSPSSGRGFANCISKHVITQNKNPSDHNSELNIMMGQILTQMRPPAPTFTEKECHDLSGKVYSTPPDPRTAVTSPGLHRLRWLLRRRLRALQNSLPKEQQDLHRRPLRTESHTSHPIHRSRLPVLHRYSGIPAPGPRRLKHH